MVIQIDTDQSVSCLVNSPWIKVIWRGRIFKLPRIQLIAVGQHVAYKRSSGTSSIAMICWPKFPYEGRTWPSSSGVMCLEKMFWFTIGLQTPKIDAMCFVNNLQDEMILKACAVIYILKRFTDQKDLWTIKVRIHGEDFISIFLGRYSSTKNRQDIWINIYSASTHLEPLEWRWSWRGWLPSFHFFLSLTPSEVNSHCQDATGWWVRHFLICLLPRASNGFKTKTTGLSTCLYIWKKISGIWNSPNPVPAKRKVLSWFIRLTTALIWRSLGSFSG